MKRESKIGLAASGLCNRIFSEYIFQVSAVALLALFFILTSFPSLGLSEEDSPQLRSQERDTQAFQQTFRQQLLNRQLDQLRNGASKYREFEHGSPSLTQMGLSLYSEKREDELILIRGGVSDLMAEAKAGVELTIMW